MRFKQVARQDDLVMRLKNITKSIRSKIDVEELIKECQKMLIARKFRRYDGRIISKGATELADWGGEVASHRSRLADIQAETINQKMRLKKLINACRNHLSSTYPEYFKGAQGRVGDKKAIIDTALTKPIDLLDDLDRLWEVSERVAKELSDSYYDNVLVKNLLDIHSRAERI